MRAMRPAYWTCLHFNIIKKFCFPPFMGFPRILITIIKNVLYNLYNWHPKSQSSSNVTSKPWTSCAALPISIPDAAHFFLILSSFSSMRWIFCSCLLISPLRIFFRISWPKEDNIKISLTTMGSEVQALHMQGNIQKIYWSIVVY